MLFLLSFSIIAASFNSVLLHKISKKSDVITLNLIVSFVWIVTLFAINKFTLHVTGTAIIWGFLYGIVQMIYLLFKARAMGSGPVSITTLIANCSLIITTAVGVVAWNESVSWMQIFGIVLLLVAFVCCTYVKADNNFSKEWIINCIFLVIFAAAVGLSFKAFSKFSRGNGTNDMMIIASVIMFGVLSGTKIILKKFGKENAMNVPEHIKYSTLGIKTIGLMIITGLLSCTYNRLNMSLAGYFPSVFFYPTFNGGVNLLSLVLGTIILKEQLTKQKFIGIIIGTIAVVIIGVF